MKHLIDPLVDCVFKAILGDPAHKEVLISFLEAITAPEHPLVDVEILNPYSPSEFVGDDLRVVDVRVRDASGSQYQIEVQLQVRPWLHARVVYSWADLYQSQLQRGEPYRKLRPLTAIWVLGENLLTSSPAWHHVFQLWDPAQSVPLGDQLRIHTLELRKWRPSSAPLADADAWVYFLKEGHGWSELPASLHIPELETAMSVLERFSDKAEDYHRYQARMNFLREQASLAEERQELEKELAERRQELAVAHAVLDDVQQALSEKDQALSEKDQALSEKDQALSEKDQALSEKDQALSEKDQALSEKEVALNQERQQVVAQERQLEALRAALAAAGFDTKTLVSGD